MTDDTMQKHLECGIAIVRFLERGGEIQKILPQYKGFRKPEKKVKIVLCQKCNLNAAEKRFTDDEGNKYNWCEKCYDE
jgi:hypothetical protein